MWTKTEIWIEGLAVSDIWDWARDVDTGARERAASAGQPIPPSERESARRVFGSTLFTPLTFDDIEM